MKRKINTICFIFVFLFLICAVSASENDNETLTSIKQPDPNQDICKISIQESQNKLESSVSNKEKLNVKVITPEKITMTAPNVKMHYKDGSIFKVTLKDKNKKAIAKAKVKISINGKTFDKTTDKKGVASINLNLNSGTYTVISAFAGTSTYKAQSVKSTVTIKSTIKCSDFTKYYKNSAAYSSKFYDKKGKLLKNTAVKFKVNSKTYSVKTDKYGAGKLNIDLKPGKYAVYSINPKTSETVSKSITIKTVLETKDLTMNQGDGSKFNVKILNSYGKPSPNKKVTLKVDGKTYTPTTDKNGIASVQIDLEDGKYSITTEYLGLKNTNQIVVNKVVKTSSFKHTTLIPNYVNVTAPYVFKNSAYSVKTGLNGIVKMPKTEVFTVAAGTKTYQFTTRQIDGVDSIVIGYKSYLIPFDGGEIKSEFNKNNLKGKGIIISRTGNYTQIDYVSGTSDNVEMFGVFADKGLENSETLTYVQNDKILAKINFLTVGFDETGLRYSLGKFYGKTIYDFDYQGYENIMGSDIESIRFANTNKPVTFSYFGRSIAGYSSKEDIITKFIINGKEELEKQETISYGLGEKYRKTLGFEVLQSYTIVSEKVKKKTLEKWINANEWYLKKFGVMNIYGMHLASLETVWIADEIADHYSNEFNVKWSRKNTLTILGGINLEDTYLNILNADMGMSVTGNGQNVELFRLINSINLPNIEEYVLEPVSRRFWDNTTNSLDNALKSISNDNFSIAQLGEMVYLFNDKDSAIVLNTTNGVCNVLLSHGNAVYKGSSIHTSEDCCGVGIMPQDIVKGIRELFKITSPGIYLLSDHFKNIHPLSTLAYKGISFLLGKILTGIPASMFALTTTMVLLQEGGVKYRNTMISEKDWHTAMDTVTFTRPGYLQGKKVYNIPNGNGGTDYVEVNINNDMTLDRNSAVYISNGQTRKLSKEETYQYFCEDYWTPFSVPTKYWDKSWGFQNESD